MTKNKRKALRDPLTGKIVRYTNTKTYAVRNPITGKIIKRVKKKNSW